MWNSTAAATSKQPHLAASKSPHTHSMNDGSRAMTWHYVPVWPSPYFTFVPKATRWQSNVGAISRGWRVRFAPDLLDVVERGVAASDLTFEHLLVSLPEVLGQEGVDDRVDGWVAVCQAVGGHAQHEGGLVQREGPELHPQVNDVMREPREAEHHHHHEDRLSRLGTTD